MNDQQLTLYISILSFKVGTYLILRVNPVSHMAQLIFLTVYKHG